MISGSVKTALRANTVDSIDFGIGYDVYNFAYSGALMRTYTITTSLWYQIYEGCQTSLERTMKFSIQVGVNTYLQNYEHF